MASKYRSVPVVIDGMRFDSKLEGRLYVQLKMEKEHGDVDYFLRQVPIHLPGGGTMRVDFQVHYKDGRKPRYLDAKGVETAKFRALRRITEAVYPIKIETWTG